MDYDTGEPQGDDPMSAENIIDTGVDSSTSGSDGAEDGED